MTDPSRHPITPDGRYFVVRGRLWRMSDPRLSDQERAAFVGDLMTARRAVGAALKTGDKAAEASARKAVDIAKHRLGERGPVWWDDGAPDYNRRLAANTPYADWFAAVPAAGIGSTGAVRAPSRRPVPKADGP